MRKSVGFSLVELLAILVIVGVLAVSAAIKFGGSSTAQLQAGRDSVVAALFVAQQLAMVGSGEIVFTSSGNRIDVRQDGSSVAVGGVSYPLDLKSNQSVTTNTFEYNRLGQITNIVGSTSVQISQRNSDSVTIHVSASGFSQ